MYKSIVLLVLFGLGVALFIFSLQNADLEQVGKAFLELRVMEFLIVLIIFFLGNIIFAAWKWTAILAEMTGKSSLFKKVFLAKWASFSLSYLTPSVFLGGEPIKYLFLKQETDISGTKIVGSILIDRLIFFLISGIYFFIGIFFILVYLDLPWLIGVVAFGLLFIFAFLFWMVIRGTERISEGKGFFATIAKTLRLDRRGFIQNNKERLIRTDKEIKYFFRLSKRKTFKAIGLGILEVSFIVASLWLVVFFMGVVLDVSRIFAIKSVVDISYAVPLPAALGALEIAQGYLFQLLGLGLASGVVFSLIFRAVSVILALGGLIILGWFQTKFFFRRIVRVIINFFKICLRNE